VWDANGAFVLTGAFGAIGLMVAGPRPLILQHQRLWGDFFSIPWAGDDK